MLNTAKLNAKSRGLDLDFYKFSASEVPDDFSNKYDVVISFGNSFANISADEFESSLSTCFSLLKGKGELFIQILNYKKILLEKKRIVSITSSEEKYFVRYYDFNENHIVFNILQFDKTNPANHQLISTIIYPYSADDFTPVLKKAGFKTINYYGSFSFTPYDPQTSNDLIITSVK